MGAFESGQSFIAGVLAKLPPEARAQAEAIFNAAEAKDAVTLVGDGALARSDYSRSMDQLREKEGALNEYYEKLNSWYGDNKAVLDQAYAAESQQPAQPAAQPSSAAAPAAIQSPATGALSAEDVRRLAEDAINAAGRDYIAVSAFIATQGAHHQHLFGEPLDALELVNNPKLGKPILGQPGRVFSLQDAYQEKYGERLVEKQREAQEKYFNEEVDKRLAERLKATASHPFPLRSESSPLDVLTTKEGPGAHTLDTAVAEYERLQAARGS
jgi:hypothetical protein